eukprot:3313746-Pyramimonas_sp.AAC.1
MHVYARDSRYAYIHAHTYVCARPKVIDVGDVCRSRSGEHEGIGNPAGGHRSGPTLRTPPSATTTIQLHLTRQESLPA